MRSRVVIAFILKTIFLIFHEPAAISIVVEVVESVVQSSSSVKGAYVLIGIFQRLYM